MKSISKEFFGGKLTLKVNASGAATIWWHHGKDWATDLLEEALESGFIKGYGPVVKQLADVELDWIGVTYNNLVESFGATK